MIQTTPKRKLKSREDEEHGKGKGAITHHVMCRDDRAAINRGSPAFIDTQSEIQKPEKGTASEMCKSVTCPRSQIHSRLGVKRIDAYKSVINKDAGQGHLTARASNDTSGLSLCEPDMSKSQHPSIPCVCVCVCRRQVRPYLHVTVTASCRNARAQLMSPC